MVFYQTWKYLSFELDLPTKHAHFYAVAKSSIYVESTAKKREDSTWNSEEIMEIKFVNQNQLSDLFLAIYIDLFKKQVDKFFKMLKYS